MWIILLAAVANARTPMSQRQWIKFVEAPVPQYDVIETEQIQPKIILVEYIDVRRPLTQFSEMVRNTMSEFAHRYQEYAEDVWTRVKRATKSQYPYGFVRKLELTHQYGMLFNHHGYVVSELKNLELFLSIELPKITDIQHMPQPFLNCDNWAVAPPSREDGYIT